MVLLGAALLCVSCKKKQAPYFVQISDPQLGFINFSEDFSPEMEIMEKMIPVVNGLEADFIVLSGDLVHKRMDTCALEAFKGLLGKFRKDLKVYCLPGNHDVGNDALPEEVDAFAVKSSKENINTDFKISDELLELAKKHGFADLFADDDFSFDSKIGDEDY